jgi:hypothetical protein
VRSDVEPEGETAFQESEDLDVGEEVRVARTAEMVVVDALVQSKEAEIAVGQMVVDDVAVSLCIE